MLLNRRKRIFRCQNCSYGYFSEMKLHFIITECADVITLDFCMVNHIITFIGFFLFFSSFNSKVQMILNLVEHDTLCFISKHVFSRILILTLKVSNFGNDESFKLNLRCNLKV